MVPLMVTARKDVGLAALLAEVWPDHARMLEDSAWRESGAALLLLIDDVQAWDGDGSAQLAAAEAFAARWPRTRVLAAGDGAVCQDWALPPAYRRHALLGWLQAQRTMARSALGLATAAHDVAPWASHPGLFVLSLGLSAPHGRPSALFDAWRQAAGRGATALPGDPPFLRALFDALHHADAPAEALARQFAAGGPSARPVLRALLDRLADDGPRTQALLAALLALDGNDAGRAAIIAADWRGGAARIARCLRVRLAADRHARASCTA